MIKKIDKPLPHLKNTIWINTLDNYIEPKKWVALPVIDDGVGYVVLIDAFGNNIRFSTKKGTYAE